ncbi:MAG: hypothetical protein U9P79_00570 [Candidatus Cloacimonadota bacterium]|nr:hypothetical protein [Candidatus Cloacimonadota bacterium]
MSETKKIIDMVADGKISAEEASKLLSAISSKSKKKKISGKKLRIIVEEENREKPKVNISIPISLAKLGIKFIPKNSGFHANINNTNFDFSSIDWKEIVELATSGETGDLFHIEVDEDDGATTTVRIFVE